MGNQFENSTTFPDTKLQSLDRRVGTDQLLFPRDLFQESIDDWNNIPVIYHPDGEHPSDFDAVKRDPASAANAIGGKLVGTVSNPRIVIPGGARLMAQLNIDKNEREITRLWKSGALVPSTAFTANSNGDSLTSAPVPNHVLIFPMRVDEVIPGDAGAYVNSVHPEVKEMKSEEKPAEDYNQGFFARVREAVDKYLSERQEPQAEVANSNELQHEEEPAKLENSTELTELQNSIEQKDAEIAELKAKLSEHPAEIESLNAEITELKNQINAMKAESANREFSELVAKLPIGMTRTEEQRNSIRAQFDAGDMKSILNSALCALNEMPSGETEKVGAKFVNSETVIEQVGFGDPCRERIENKRRCKK